VVEELAKRGVLVMLLGKYNWRLGSMQIVWRDKKTDMLGDAANH
jgi:hypothetical protein